MFSDGDPVTTSASTFQIYIGSRRTPAKCSAVRDPESTAASVRAGAKRAVTANLKDPDSARFQTIVYAHVRCDDGSDRVLACGRMNARNSYGGYTGYKFWLFVPGNTEKTTWSEDEVLTSPTSAKMVDWLALCTKHGTT
jgi:hypothetical protein